MWTCNTLYIIDMPLYITADLGLPEGLAGVLMGTAAGLEIPAMLLAGYYVKRFGKRNMMLLAVAAGVLFYLGLIVLAAKLAPDRAAAAQRGVYRHRRRYRHALFSRFDAGPMGAATTLFTNSISTGVIPPGCCRVRWWRTSVMARCIGWRRCWRWRRSG